MGNMMIYPVFQTHKCLLPMSSKALGSVCGVASGQGAETESLEQLRGGESLHRDELEGPGTTEIISQWRYDFGILTFEMV